MPKDNPFRGEFKRILLLIAAVALAFSPCLFNSFVYWDDDSHLFENVLALSRDWSAWPAIFATVVNKTYIPLTILSFNLEHRIFGLNPFFFHLDNILLHIANCLLIYRLIGRIGFDRNTALLAALLFGIHPMHVEPVAWMTARKDVLYSLFYILAMDRYWIFLSDGKRPPYLWSLIFGFLSILAKPMALSLPLVLGLLMWYKNKKLTTRSLLGILPFAALIVPVAWITYNLNSRVPNLDLGRSILLWAWTSTFYIKKFLTPFVLLPLYQVPQPVSILNPTYFSGILLLIVIPTIMWVWRRNRLFMFACFFYILSTFFLWRYDQAVDVTIVGDRFMYLPSAGFCLFFADAFVRKPQLKWIALAVIIFCVVKTPLQCRVWQDDLTLWNYVIGHKQEVFQAYNSRGVALTKLKDKNALADFDHALALNPSYARGFYNRGKFYADQGDSGRALADFDQAIALNPKDNKYYLERGVTRSKRGEFEKAVGDFNAALDLKPDDAGAYNNRGIAYKKMGNLQAALKDYTTAMQLNPRSAQTYLNRANLWQETKHYQEALSDLKIARSLGFPVEPARLIELERLVQGQTGN